MKKLILLSLIATAAHAQYVAPAKFMPFIDAYRTYNTLVPWQLSGYQVTDEQIMAADYGVVMGDTLGDFKLSFDGTSIFTILASDQETELQVMDSFLEYQRVGGVGYGPFNIPLIENPLTPTSFAAKAAAAPEIGLDGAALTLLVGGVLVVMGRRHRAVA